MKFKFIKISNFHALNWFRHTFILVDTDGSDNALSMKIGVRRNPAAPELDLPVPPLGGGGDPNGGGEI